MRRALAAVLTVVSVLPAAAASVDQVAFEVENFTKDENFAELTIKVTNKGSAPLKRAFLECGFLDKTDKAVDVGIGLASNLAAGGSGYVQVSVTASPAIEKASCRVNQVTD